jgi:hypothetical protein
MHFLTSFSQLLFEFSLGSFTCWFVLFLNSFRSSYVSSLIWLTILLSSLRVYPLNIIQILFCGIIYFWRRHVALFFHITFISTLGFIHQRPSFWLKVLISHVLSVEVFKIFRQTWVIVATLWCGLV